MTDYAELIERLKHRVNHNKMIAERHGVSLENLLDLEAIEAIAKLSAENAELRKLLGEARLMCEDGDGLIDSEALAYRIDGALKNG